MSSHNHLQSDTVWYLMRRVVYYSLVQNEAVYIVVLLVWNLRIYGRYIPNQKSDSFKFLVLRETQKIEKKLNFTNFENINFA